VRAAERAIGRQREGPFRRSEEGHSTWCDPVR
jgi:hypothetical protein